MLSDGSAGFWEIHKRGGVTISQHPADAQWSAMPQNAMKDVPVHYCLRTAEIGPKLRELVEGSSSPPLFAKGRVMIVEDELIVAADLEAQLTDLGYEVVASVDSGEAALATAGS